MIYKITKITYKSNKFATFICDGIGKHAPKFVKVKTGAPWIIEKLAVGVEFQPIEWNPFVEKWMDVKTGEEKSYTRMKLDRCKLNVEQDNNMTENQKNLAKVWKDVEDTENIIDWGDE